MSIYDKVDKLRLLMKKRGIEAYYIPTSDPHQSEYLANYYKTREFISGFTGSAGYVVITHDKAALWTDGRYFVQAEKELSNTPFKLYKIGIDIDFLTFLDKEVSEFGKIGVDGKCLSLAQYKMISEELGNRLLLTDVDFISEIWEDRPKLPKSEAWIFDSSYCGQTVQEKLTILRQMMKSREVEYNFIGALEDVAYLYNLRGGDIFATPVFFSYAVVSLDRAFLFVDSNKIDIEVRKFLEENKIEVYDYNDIFEFMQGIKGTNAVYLDPSRTNVKVYQSINKNVKISTGINLTTLMKAIKNDKELVNFRIAHHKDGIALIKLFNWIETGVKSGSLDELSVVNKLLEIKSDIPNFIEPSFGTISAYGENAAMPHYNPKIGIPETLQKKGLLLVDSGSQYLEGTTDITRTIALGELTEDEKIHYTLTLKAALAGLTAKFKKGNTGYYLDSLVRNPIYKAGLDFGHGTGHGVGFVLGVHEGPMSISSRDKVIPLQKGMVFSIEPGIYIEGKHGIRIETIVTLKQAVEEDMLEVEPLMYIPIDTRPVLKYMLEQWELKWLNNYNRIAREELSPELSGSDLEYLKMITREL